MSLLGFAPYLAYVFLPGLGVGELLRAWKREDGFAARLAYCLGIGLCSDTLVLVVKTAGVTAVLKGLDLTTVYATAAGGLALLVASLAVRRQFTWWKKPTRLDLAFLAILLAQGVILLLYFQKYPIFPQSSSHDFLVHVQNTEGLITGSYVTIPGGVLYNGIYFQLAPALLLVGGTPLVTVRLTMGILTLLSPLLFYLAALRLSSSEACAVLVALVYALSGTIWFGSVLNSGLYANFFGILAALFLMVSFLDAASNPWARGTAATLVLATVTAYFSHFSLVTMLPAILLYPFIKLAVGRRVDRQALEATGVVILPGLVGVAAYPHEIQRLLFAETATASVTGSTVLSRLVSSYPVLSYMIFEVYSDAAFLVMACLACVYIWRLGRSKNPALAIPVVWFATLLVVSPFNVAAWRYSYEALVPFMLMAGLGLYYIVPKPERLVRRRAGSGTGLWKSALVLALVLTPVVGYSWGGFAFNDAVTNASSVAQNQRLVNESIAWLGANTPSNASYVSLTDWRFAYTSLLIGRDTSYGFASLPSEGIALAQKAGADYIIVTYLITESLPANSSPSAYPWNNFPTRSDANLTLIYSNADVRIYRVV